MKVNVLCPVCGKYIFKFENDFDICDVCGWENDGVQAANFDYSGGANYISVNDAKVLYDLSLNEDLREELTKMRQIYESKRAAIHKKYNGKDFRIVGEKCTLELNKAHNKFISKLIELKNKQ